MNRAPTRSTAPTHPLRRPWWLLPLALALSVGTSASVAAATAAAIALLAVGLAVALRDRVADGWGVVFAASLLGYAVAGRGAAYLGAPPLYLGEILVASGLVVALVAGRWAFLRTPLAVVLVMLMAWGAARTLPYVPSYGLTALRDAVVWGYATIALVVASLLTTRSRIFAVVRAYDKALPFLLVAMPIALLASSFAADRLPHTPGSDVAIVDAKRGDVAVHLAGALAFLALGFETGRDGGRAVPTSDPAKRSSLLTRARRWLLALLWLLAWITTFGSRAAILTVLAAATLLAVLRPRSGWWRIGYLALLLLVLAVTFDLRYEAGNGRVVSADTVAVAVTSLFDTVDVSAYDGTRRWRLEWWTDIVDYTVFGDYRWTGKGFGINLANADGYQVWADDSLRSPHNAVMTILARSGVPGVSLWLLLHIGVLGALLNASRARRREGRLAWMRVDITLAVYLLAFHVNASFDVYLEGPQGGIWFWAVTGAALAALRLQWADAREAAMTCALAPDATHRLHGSLAHPIARHAQSE